MLKRMCAHTGCRKIIDADRIWCEKHEAQHRQQHSRYKRQRMQDSEEARRQRFYSSGKWENCRACCEAWCFGIDVLELYRTGAIIPAETYHHIVEITVDFSKRLDTDEIIGLSDRNHAMVHAAYERGPASRNRVQQELRQAKRWFRETYRRFDETGRQQERTRKPGGG